MLTVLGLGVSLRGPRTGLHLGVPSVSRIEGTGTEPKYISSSPLSLNGPVTRASTVVFSEKFSSRLGNPLVSKKERWERSVKEVYGHTLGRRK